MSAIPASLNPESPWKLALPAIVVVLVAITLAFLDTVTVMVGIWHRSETFAHAFLVLPISLWLVWRMRARLAQMTPRPSPLFLLPMAAVAAVWLLADVMVVNAPAQFAFVALLCLAVPAVLGVELALAMLFPLLFLFFMVPFGEFMLEPMMEWTADFVVYALRLTGIPVYREGLQFVIPTGNWSVVTECSGVRYLIASFMVGSLFAYLNYRSHAKRALFMLVALLVPIVANWLRAYLIVMVGHLSGNKLAAGADHILYGWVFFGIVIFVMFSIGMRWADADEPAADAVPSGSVDASVTHVRRPLVMAAVAAMLVALAPQGVLWGLARSEQGAAAPALKLPDRLAADWTGTDDPVAGWSPHFPGATVESRQVYQGPAGKVGVYVGYYRHQDVERKLVSSINGVVAINDRTWNRVGSGSRDLVLDGATTTVRTGEIRGPAADKGARRPLLVTWQTYWIDGQLVAGDARAKVAGAVSRLRGRGDDGAALILYADADSVEAADRALEAFARTNLGALRQLLQRTRDSR